MPPRVGGDLDGSPTPARRRGVHELWRRGPLEDRDRQAGDLRVLARLELEAQLDGSVLDDRAAAWLRPEPEKPAVQLERQLPARRELGRGGRQGGRVAGDAAAGQREVEQLDATAVEGSRQADGEPNAGAAIASEATSGSGPSRR